LQILEFHPLGVPDIPLTPGELFLFRSGQFENPEEGLPFTGEGKIEPGDKLKTLVLLPPVDQAVPDRDGIPLELVRLFYF
jgi:hypothetical protein